MDEAKNNEGTYHDNIDDMMKDLKSWYSIAYLKLTLLKEVTKS
jgi:hypothetical protein